MKTYFKASIVSLALVVSGVLVSPSAQVQIQRGYGPTASAGSSGSVVGIGGVLTVSTTSAQTGANTTETDLWTYSLPANTLSANGYGVRITTFGTLGSNGNNKTVRVYFGATSVTGGTVSTNGGAWRAVFDVIRSGASGQLMAGTFFRDAVTNTPFTQFATPAADTTGAITIKVTGQNGTASDGDIVFRGAVVEFLRAGS